tara:strand:- start:999 stop:1211 length:213 start_codon:yes stop_codon:yes gene_type:complete
MNKKIIVGIIAFLILATVGVAQFVFQTEFTSDLAAQNYRDTFTAYPQKTGEATITDIAKTFISYVEEKII